MTGSHHVTVTGLRLRSPRHLPVFWWHAVRSMAQARRSPGNLRAEARTIDGVHHTLTAWRSAADARAYARTGAHRAASRTFDRIATGRIASWEVPVGAAAPSALPWEEALARWTVHGRAVGGPRRHRAARRSGR